MTSPAETHVHVHLHGFPEWGAQLTRIEEKVMSAVEQLTEIKAQLADTKADVLAKIENLESQLGELSPEAQALVDEIKADLSGLDVAVGDADGSDTPTPDPEPIQE